MSENFRTRLKLGGRGSEQKKSLLKFCSPLLKFGGVGKDKKVLNFSDNIGVKRQILSRSAQNLPKELCF